MGFLSEVDARISLNPQILIDSSRDRPPLGRGVAYFHLTLDDDTCGKVDGAGNFQFVAVKEARHPEWIELVHELVVV
jgi:hypothetical protein